jgi:signal transduction histidine kinase/ligand-binding sensor domain-containing protein
MLLLALALAGHPAPSARAQAPPVRTPVGGWIIDRWSSDQGLPQNTINDILQTPDGFLWIATYGGLVRFDGVRFKSFTTLDYPALGSDRVMVARAGADGSIWLGTDRGLVHFAGGAFTEWTEKDGRPAGQSTAVLPNADGSVWVATSVGGLALFRNGRFERFGNRGLPDGFVESVWTDSRGAVWINRGAAHFFVMRGDSVFRPARITTPSDIIQVSGVDSAGSIWFVTHRGSARLAGMALSPPFVDGERIRDDRKDGYWTVVPNGLLHAARDGTLERIDGPADAGLNEVHAFFVDRDGVPWIGTMTMGLLRLRRRLFRTYTTADGLPTDRIAAIFRDRGGRLLVGSNCDKTSIRAGETFKVTALPGCAFAFAQTPDGSLWAGGYGGATVVSPDGRTETHFLPDSIHSAEVLAIHADRDSTVWIGTGNGLIHATPRGWIRFGTADGLPSAEVHCIVRDHSGMLWIGTIGGLARLRPDGHGFDAWTTREGLPHNAVRAIYEDADHVHWIGTYGGGLARFDGEHFVTISSRNGLYDDVVSSIHEDAGGNLWMAGNRGIFRANRRALNAFASGAEPFVPSPGYGPADGLLSPETNGGFEPSAWQDGDGRLWFATIRGLATVDPSDIAADARLASAAIDAVRVDGKPVPADSIIRTPVGKHAIEIDYTAITASDAQQLVFRYRLEGLDAAWTYANHRRTAYLSQIPPGRYTFVVMASDPDGRWSAPQRMRLIVPAPWYATTWFRLLLFAATLGAITLLVRQRFARLRARERQQREFARRLMAAQEAERRRIAGELHDSLTQDLLVMKNRASMALRSADVGDTARTHILEIAEVAGQASRNAREISHNLRPHQLDHLGLGAALRDLAERAGIPAALSVEVDASGIDDAFGPEESIQVFRIVQEALNNVLRHSGAGRVAVRFSREGDTGHLVITDDGRGFDLARGPGFGLNGIGERVQLIGGRLDIRSAPGRGTEIGIECRISRPRVRSG